MDGRGKTPGSNEMRRRSAAAALARQQLPSGLSDAAGLVEELSEESDAVAGNSGWTARQEDPSGEIKLPEHVLVAAISQSRAGQESNSESSSSDTDDEAFGRRVQRAGVPQEHFVRPARAMPGAGNLFADARSVLGRFHQLPVFTRMWVASLLICTVAVQLSADVKPALALHWPSVQNGELWRCASTFICFGGQSLSLSTLLAFGMVVESVAQLENYCGLTASVNLTFLAALVGGAVCLLASQHYGVHLGLYEAYLHCDHRGQIHISPELFGSSIGLAVNSLYCPSHRYWLSHDLTFLLFCVSCWLSPSHPTQLGFLPGVPPLPRALLPFVVSLAHVLLSGTTASIYLEALLLSVPVVTFAVCVEGLQLALAGRLRPVHLL